MNPDHFLRRRKLKVTMAALAVGLIMSALVALALIYMSGVHSR